MTPVVISDIDGTLLAEGEHVSRIQPFVEACAEHEIELILATARPLATLLSFPWSMYLRGIIPYNGLCYYDMEKGYIDNVQVLDSPLDDTYEFNKLKLIPSEMLFVTNEEQRNVALQSDSKRNVCIDDYSMQTTDISMLSMSYVEIGKELELYRNRFLNLGYSVLDYSENRFGNKVRWLEIVPNNVGKETQLSCMKFLPGQIIYGLGNGWNDVGMLSLVDVAICPVDSEESVKNICDHISNARGGCEFYQEILDGVYFK